MPAFVAALLGVVFRGVFAVLQLFRHPRPIHSRGLVLIGEVRRTRAAVPSGIAWIDGLDTATADGAGIPHSDIPGDSLAVRARVSRSVGLPSWLPDVIGLALRVDIGGTPADIELSSSGTGVPGRFLLAPRWSAAGGTFNTLLPYRGSRGPVLVSARSVEPDTLPANLAALRRELAARPWRVTLAFATPAGPWHPFADVILRAAPDQDDTDLRFDAVRRSLPGAGWYRWIRVLRQPSYRLVQDGATGVRRRRSGPPGR
ncbi:hypothetical protein ACFUTX_11745 [Microbacterium sp. NPDC057407]|uniref:hypothetical protein n=1 Tax=Microbacterium sp. NPDC057407 TaxID=3346120 RepID=UPI00366D6DEB